MPPPNTPRKIILAGATGTIGTPLLHALLAAGHTVSILTRPSSTPPSFPPGVHAIHQIPYTPSSIPALTTALTGQDILITALAFTAYESQPPLFHAAAAAKVRFIVPTEYGSDASAPLNAHIGIMTAKAPYRALLEDLGVPWIGVATNPWFDLPFNFGPRGLGFDIPARRVALLDAGDAKCTFSTRRRVGETVAAVLALPEEELAAYKNAWVFCSSFRVSQRDVWASVRRATGTAEGDWAVRTVGSWDVVERAKEGREAEEEEEGPGLLFALLFAEGMGGNFGEKVVDYERLGMRPEEDLDEVVRAICDEAGFLGPP